jgi:hypothetical protein
MPGKTTEVSKTGAKQFNGSVTGEALIEGVRRAINDKKEHEEQSEKNLLRKLKRIQGSVKGTTIEELNESVEKAKKDMNEAFDMRKEELDKNYKDEERALRKVAKRT